ncbi:MULTISPECIES: hypothetical protein [Nocardioides]|uniref:Uncharacterized protein n=1 Tax=Nocardioides vastitatis TaxID=2568655 RepID=A0ABW0ZAH9_9ACTN|nr:hypothetical protein [Nocardioides sp.]THI95425.1 hypothetical protein E7Z54_19215 [Nocardioides sp.]
MELHEALRELVASHGTSILADATGFRGVLDDVLEEDQASTGDINLLVDAVRFDALTPLTQMIDGGADPARAVEEAGMRLARNRGGDDQAASSWASAVLGYAVGRVPEAVVMRYRSHRPASTALPPPGAAAAGPPLQSPPQTAWPSPPTMLPGHGSAPQPGQPGQPGQLPYGQPGYGPPSYGQPGSVPPVGSVPQPGSYGAQPHGFAPAPPKKKSPLVWVAAAVVGLVVVAAGVTGLVFVSGDEDPGPGPGPSPGPETPTVDVDPAAIDSRYDSLASKITTGATDCKVGTAGSGEKEVIECTVPAGSLRLVTYADAESLTAARTARVDHRAGTLSSDKGATALYQFDPERGGTSDPAIVYWDSQHKLQSATITGDAGSKLDSLKTIYTSTSPRVVEPVNPQHPVLREFININMSVSSCTRQLTYFAGETEESSCQANVDGVVVNVGRYSTQRAMRADRKYYRSQYQKAPTKGSGGTWKFGEGPAEGAYYAYLDSTGETATLYWDWNKADCHCYGVAWSFDGDLQKLEDWWPSE